MIPPILHIDIDQYAILLYNSAFVDTLWCNIVAFHNRYIRVATTS